MADVVLFLLPGGRPRFLVAVAIQAGGRPRRFPLPLASRSRLMIASSICSRSWRSSASIFVTSIVCKAPKSDCLPAGRSVPKMEQDCMKANAYFVCTPYTGHLQVVCSENRTAPDVKYTSTLPVWVPSAVLYLSPRSRAFPIIVKRNTGKDQHKSH